MKRPKQTRRVRYMDNNFEDHEATIIQRNGQLVLIEDKATGDCEWIPDFMNPVCVS